MTTGFLADLALDFEFYAISYGVYLAGVIALIALFFLMFSSNLKKGNLRKITGIDGKVIYADEGKRSKYFINHTYSILAKPDFIVKLKDGGNAVLEYKNRNSGALCQLPAPKGAGL